MNDLGAEIPDNPNLIDRIDQTAFVGAVEGVDKGAPILEFNLVDAAETLLNDHVAGAGKPPGQGFKRIEFIFAIRIFDADRLADVIFWGT